MRDRESFAALRRTGVRARSGPLRLTWTTAPSGPPRLAFAIGKPVGSAVVRNRLRRRLRALVAEAIADGRVAPGTYLIATQPGAASLSYDELRAHLMNAMSLLPRPTATGSSAPVDEDPT